MKKVLVAGATGYLGKYAAQAFKNHGYHVKVLARNRGKLEKKGPFLEPSLKNVTDEVFVGEITKLETLRGVCDEMDVIFSSVGITRQKDGVTYHDVDYQGNLNLLKTAQASSAGKFIFVSVFHAELLKSSEMVDARENFADELKKSGMNYSIVRPTGYFSDMTEILKMAKAGRVYLFGSGRHRMNPIHGADLAEVCVRAAKRDNSEVEAGGPQVYSYEEIAQIAFAVLNKRLRVTRIPSPAVKAMLKIIYPLNRRLYNQLSFISASMQMDHVAPKSGTHQLEQYFQDYLSNRDPQELN